jgi:hypothetical protein
MALLPGGPPPIGSTNPFTGGQTSIDYMGSGVWAGWSGSVSATQGSDGTLYNFKSPGVGLKVLGSFSFDENNLNANAFLGLKIKLNGITMYNMRVKKSSDAGFTNLDSDSIRFIIPAFTEVLITSFTDDTDNIPTLLNLVCDQI